MTLRTEALDLVSEAGFAPGTAQRDALLNLLVHVSFADGQVQDDELAVLSRLIPGRPTEALRTWVRQSAARPLDLEALATALSTDDQRWTALRFASRMAWGDTFLDPAERALLQQVADALHLAPGAVARVLRETAGPPAQHLSREALDALLDEVPWAAAQFANGPIASPDLVPHVPADGTLVRRGGIDAAEVLGIYVEGLVARFLEGATFLPWEDIIGVTRGKGLDATLRLHDADGRVWSLLDARLGGLANFLDRLYRPGTLPPTTPPRVKRIARRNPVAEDTYDP